MDAVQRKRENGLLRDEDEGVLISARSNGFHPIEGMKTMDKARIADLVRGLCPNSNNLPVSMNNLSVSLCFFLVSEFVFYGTFCKAEQDHFRVEVVLSGNNATRNSKPQQTRLANDSRKCFGSDL